MGLVVPPERFVRQTDPVVRRLNLCVVRHVARWDIYALTVLVVRRNKAAAKHAARTAKHVLTANVRKVLARTGRWFP